VVYLYIDNVHGYFTEEAEARQFVANLLRNMKWYNVQLKYAFIDGQEQDPSYTTTGEQLVDIEVKLADKDKPKQRYQKHWGWS
jgi:hypothetical protein